ncbi:TonB-dependent receptor domain-containing protein [Elongatibacter sediminis]|uniref:TonB-dependent receptor n=1 Tax=Elongatibacter sediminis TaxID=3119006 RepID=A0AAW9R8D7_9GAMM
MSGTRFTLTLVTFACCTFSAIGFAADRARYVIHPQPLDSALKVFAEKTGYQVVYPPKLVNALESTGSSHFISGQQLMHDLLRDTGLTFEFVNDRTITLRQGGADAKISRVNASHETSLTGPLLAQNEPAPGSQTDSSQSGSPASSASLMEEITVTARRKQESIQDVPITVSAFTGDQLKTANIVNLDDVAPMTPGMYFGKQNESRPQLYIRGVGSRQFDAGAEGSVGLFIDEVYVGRFSAGLSGLFDIERVEVLKGPQGTLYGRNTIGGAINIITNQPTEEFSANAEVSLGNYDYIAAQGAIGGAIGGSEVLGRLAFDYRERDGYVTNLTTGTRHKPLEQFAVRGKLLFRPTDTLDIKLTVDVNQADPDAGLQGEYVGGLPVLATPGFLPPPETTPDRFNEFYNTDSRFERDLFGINARLDWSFDNFSLTSITAYGEVDLSEARDLDSTPVDGMEHITDEESSQFSQEFRLSSTPGGWLTFDDRVDWIFGAYYLVEKPDRLENLRGGLDSIFSRIAASIDAGGPPAPIAPGQMHIDNFLDVNVETTSLAFFGQASIDLSDRMSLTLGARYTHDRKEGVYTGTSNRDFVPPIILPFTVELSPSWESFDPKVSLDYAWTDDIMTYVSYSEGFKSGGFQFAKFNAEEAREVFDPEDVVAYEIGMKSSLFNRRLRLNASAFYYDYSDLQVAKTLVSDGGAPSISTVNAAAATTKGLEVEGSWMITDSLFLDFGYAYLDATFDEYIFDDELDFTGNDLPRAPEHSFNAAVTFEQPVGAGLIRFRGDYSWIDDHFFEPDQGLTLGTTQEAFGLLNISLAYEQGPWRVSAWARNLTDEVYRTTTLSFGPPSPTTFTMEYLGLPRTYGVTIGWRYE